MDAQPIFNGGGRSAWFSLLNLAAVEFSEVGDSFSPLIGGYADTPMPHYCIHIAMSDGSRDNYDLVGPTLDQIGAVRALVTETLIEACRALPPLGAARTIAITVEDKHRLVVVRDSVTIRGRAVSSLDDQALWRAMSAMNRVQRGRSR